MAVGHDFQRRQREEDRRVHSPVSGNAKRLSHAGLVARDFLPPAQVATSGDNSRIVVHEIRTGFRTFFDIAHDVEGDRRTSSVSNQLPRILRFASSGRLLAVGDNCGQVHLFQLGHSAGEAGRSTPAHRVLCLSGEVVDILLHDEQLARVACWHAANAQREHLDKEDDLHQGEENKVLVLWHLPGKFFAEPFGFNYRLKGVFVNTYVLAVAYIILQVSHVSLGVLEIRSAHRCGGDRGFWGCSSISIW